ncbi:MAG: peptide MFS transporter [Planctomycetota bacterium]|jgi:dipeptide/tripeptide permease
MTKGHPKGLYPLFFTEMWERLAFYLMLGILVLYATDTERGGLGLSVELAAEIYGTYLAFVYFTPFLGGMIADRYLGYRRAVFLGGLCMAAGLFCLGVRSLPTFYTGLTLLCVGNGFFKPNISAMVGNLYEPGDPKRDSGFNIFYMGINIGATFSAILAAPLRNYWNFNVAFIAAGVGLLLGVIILSFNWKKLAKADRQPERDPEDTSLGKVALVILLPAAVFGGVGYFVGDSVAAIDDSIGKVTFAFIVGMLPILSYFIFLVIKANPEEKPGLAALLPVYVAGGAFFMILHLSGGLMTFFTEHNTNREGDWVPAFAQESYCQKAMPSYFSNADPELARPHEDTLLEVDQRLESLFGAKRISVAALAQIAQTYQDVKILDTEDPAYDTSWNFLACKVFNDENIEVTEEKDAHGLTTVSVSVVPETASSLREVVLLREMEGQTFPVLLVTKSTLDEVYEKASDTRLDKGKFLGLVNAELIVGLLNPVFVVALTPLVVAFFAFMVRRKREVSTARKIFYGMVMTTISLAVMAWGAYVGGDGESKVSVWWLVYYYLIITVGELCLSPMGLSLVTKLAPKRLVGLMMGGWFLSTSVGNKLAGFISGLPSTTLMFLILGGAILLVALFIFILLPRLDSAIKKYGA